MENAFEPLIYKEEKSEQEVLDFWTEERMNRAKPMPIPEFDIPGDEAAEPNLTRSPENIPSSKFGDSPYRFVAEIYSVIDGVEYVTSGCVFSSPAYNQNFAAVLTSGSTVYNPQTNAQADKNGITVKIYNENGGAERYACKFWIVARDWVYRQDYDQNYSILLIQPIFAGSDYGAPELDFTVKTNNVTLNYYGHRLTNNDTSSVLQVVSGVTKFSQLSNFYIKTNTNLPLSSTVGGPILAPAGVNGSPSIQGLASYRKAGSTMLYSPLLRLDVMLYLERIVQYGLKNS